MDWRSRQPTQPAAQYSGHYAQPETQYAGHYAQSGQNGLCYVCGNYSDRLRRVCIHNNQDMLICWVCELCDVRPSVTMDKRTKR